MERLQPKSIEGALSTLKLAVKLANFETGSISAAVSLAAIKINLIIKTGVATDPKVQ